MLTEKIRGGGESEKGKFGERERWREREVIISMTMKRKDLEEREANESGKMTEKYDTRM